MISDVVVVVFFSSCHSAVITSLHLKVCTRFPVHRTQRASRTVITGVEASLWHPSFPSLNRSRAAGQAPPAPAEEGGDKVEVSICLGVPENIYSLEYGNVVILYQFPKTLHFFD